jgi:hypothetical protein
MQKTPPALIFALKTIKNRFLTPFFLIFSHFFSFFFDFFPRYCGITGEEQLGKTEEAFKAYQDIFEEICKEWVVILARFKGDFRIFCGGGSILVLKILLLVHFMMFFCDYFYYIFRLFMHFFYYGKAGKMDFLGTFGDFFVRIG